MSMTLEEAIECLKTIQRWTPEWDYREDGLSYWDAIDMALSALRPVSREQLERLWPGCKMCKTPSIAPPVGFYCPWCGTPRSQMAWEELRKKLEMLKDGKGD